MQGKDVGIGLFDRTIEAAKDTGARVIDATIRTENTSGFAYYGKLGFTEHRGDCERILKRFDVA